MPALREGSRVFPWLLAVFFAAAAAFFALRFAATVRETRHADAAPVVQAMRKIAQLATVEAEISDVMRFEELKSFLVFDFPKSATIRMRGKVVAGFDLTAPQFHVAAQPEKRRLAVSLPPPRILALDPRLEWFDEDSGILNPITPQDRTRWMLWARGQLARAAKNSGIEERAVAHARELLAGAAEAFGWTAEVEGVSRGSATPVPTP
ncbi:MAG TPA: DUF4230 domain-containing protein [Thermoanaerobaculia bacterium]|nr:DUF4230 domain-containing protein [Thermoanaerobaculia bacterium]